MSRAPDEGLEEIDRDECLRLLMGRGVGRVAVTIGAVPAVFPVNYGLLDEAVVFRTGAGTKLDAAVRHAVVAFEVDEIDTLYHEGWSVLVVGRAVEITDGPTFERAEHLPLRPWAGGARTHLVAVRAEIVTGRRIVPH
jgi:uncharacterized protein